MLLQLIGGGKTSGPNAPTQAQKDTLQRYDVPVPKKATYEDCRLLIRKIINDIEQQNLLTKAEVQKQKVDIERRQIEDLLSKQEEAQAKQEQIELQQMTAEMRSSAERASEPLKEEQAPSQMPVVYFQKSAFYIDEKNSCLIDLQDPEHTINLDSNQLTTVLEWTYSQKLKRDMVRKQEPSQSPKQQESELTMER